MMSKKMKKKGKARKGKAFGSNSTFPFYPHPP
jgi:hypothetical protein